MKIKSNGRLSRFPIQKKIFLAMLLISVIPILLLAYFSFNISQANLKEQLIQNRVLGMEWMNDKLSSELEQYAELFYQIEVNRGIKNGLISWGMGNQISYGALAEIRKIFEEKLNSNAKIRSIEVYNFATMEGYIANRTSFYTGEFRGMGALWEKRQEDMQTNIVVKRDEDDFFVLHKLQEFSTGKTVAVILLRLNKYAFSDLIEESMQEGESAYLYNDEGELLNEFNKNVKIVNKQHISGIVEKIKADSLKLTTDRDGFYFYESINQGKINLLYILPDQLIKNQLRDTVKVAVVIMISSFAVSVLLSVLFSEIISKPIIVLSNRMQKADIRNFTAKDEIGRADEIGLLQISFENMMKRNQELVALEYQSELEKKNAQLRALQAQINPHFIYNTLQVIGGMSVTGRDKEIYPLVTAFSDILRYSISFQQDTVALEQEITYLESYISIQNSRFENRLQFEIDIKEEIRKAQIPKLIFQPIVENCLEHGLAKKKGAWKIALSAYAEDGTGNIIIKITDNGIGIAEEQLEEIRCSLNAAGKNILSKSDNIGLSNVHARIQLQSGHNYGLEIQSTLNKGTTITIRIRGAFV